MISQKLSEARVYEIKKEAEIAIENRPVFHLTDRKSPHCLYHGAGGVDR